MLQRSLLKRLPLKISSPFFVSSNGSRFFSSVPQKPKLPGWSMKGALATSITCFCFGLTWNVLNSQHQKDKETSFTESSTVGQPQIGGDWTLTNTEGQLVSSSTFKGKYQLLYFGFTFCPDICPQELEKQTQVAKKVNDHFKEELVVPIFITVDPKRDKVPEVKEYCQEFSSSLQGFTGTEEEIKKVTKLFRVYFNEGIKTSEEDYLIDHSIIHYLMGPTNSFKEFFGKNLTTTEMEDKIIEIIKEDKRKKAQRKA